MVDDTVTGARSALPAKLVPHSERSGSGTPLVVARGADPDRNLPHRADPARRSPTVFEQKKKEPPGRKPKYSVLRDDFFVISGLQGLKKFYVRAQLRDDEVRGFTILYDQAMAGIMDPVVVAMSSAFAAFSGTGRPPIGPPPRRKVEYASGIAVSAAGHIAHQPRAAPRLQRDPGRAGFGDADRARRDDKGAGSRCCASYGAPISSPSRSCMTARAAPTSRSSASPIRRRRAAAAR